MISMTQIQDLASRIGEKFSAERVLLFGSYAYGTPNEDSDVDVLVIMPFSGSNLSKAAEIARVTNPNFSVDVIVWRPAELERRLSQGDWFLREIISKGKVLYDASHAGVG